MTALETKACGLAGIIIWGCHRDTAELIAIGFPIFSYGICLAGPLRNDRRDQDAFTSAHFGNSILTQKDVVFADADGGSVYPRQTGRECYLNRQEHFPARTPASPGDKTRPQAS
jgi:regulator of RNase E activity RraA